MGNSISWFMFVIAGIFIGIMITCTVFDLLSTAKKIENGVSKYELKKVIDYDAEKINKTFEDLLTDEFEFYSRKHPDLFQAGNYLKPEEIKDITAIVTTRVMQRMTPALRNNLTFVYNWDSEEDLITLVGERVGMIVVALAAEVNSSLEDNELIKK